MEENRRFFRADVEVKSFFRSIEPKDVNFWKDQIHLGLHEDLCRTYLAGEDSFLKKAESLAESKDDIRDLLLFINEKVNYVLHTTSMMQTHPLNNISNEMINLGGGGCALLQDFKINQGFYALLEIILPRTNRYVRALIKSVHSVASGNKWRNGYAFEKISIEDQDAIMGYLFTSETLDKAVGESTHNGTDDASPYN